MSPQLDCLFEHRQPHRARERMPLVRVPNVNPPAPANASTIRVGARNAAKRVIATADAFRQRHEVRLRIRPPVRGQKPPGAPCSADRLVENQQHAKLIADFANPNVVLRGAWSAPPQNPITGSMMNASTDSGPSARSPRPKPPRIAAHRWPASRPARRAITQGRRNQNAALHPPHTAHIPDQQTSSSDACAAVIRRIPADDLESSACPIAIACRRANCRHFSTASEPPETKNARPAPSPPARRAAHSTGVALALESGGIREANAC